MLPAEKEFILFNRHKFTRKDFAQMFGVPQKVIQDFCFENGVMCKYDKELCKKVKKIEDMEEIEVPEKSRGFQWIKADLSRYFSKTIKESDDEDRM